MSAAFYNTIEGSSTAIFKDRGSRFLGFAFPINNIEDFKLHRAQLKKEHPKANHHCFAYRLGTEGTAYRMSDDGEPSGSAGRPILGQIDSNRLTNLLIVVIRYFGGTLLGVPGLINAYKTRAAHVLQQTVIIQRPVLVNCRMQFDYMLMNEIMKLVKEYDCIIFKQHLQLFCLLEIGIPKSKLDAMLIKLKELRGLEIVELAQL
jgi:uncharacterized YigZ family protein